MTDLQRAILILQDGTTFRGRPWGARGRAIGPVRLDPTATGFAEALADPLNAGGLVLFTYPHVGNTGHENQELVAAGCIAREPARRPSHWQSAGPLPEAMAAAGVVGISHLDTRALTRHLVQTGPQLGAIFSGEALPLPQWQLTESDNSALPADVVASLLEVFAELEGQD
ncbi:carbamoyl-phosphate synthase domain-containing protein [Scrofimicrobium sp. R131]|uniref:Carbamoyl-phosphate synthase domain-containing protein n=1 Tax=Scrofimicrobium appendicitidis TaxID=3079930 RepID=A0AAU7V9V5_9ACTO